MGSFFRLSLWLLAIAPFAMNAHAFSIAKQGNAVVKWTSFTIPYKIHESGSDNIHDGSDLAAIKQGFADWEAISCSKISFKYLGTTTNTEITSVDGSYNGQNELVWIEGNNWPHGGYVLAVTGPIYDWNGVILEADIGFNGRQILWSTSGQPSWTKQDVLNVAIHEEGHFIGVQHVLNPSEYNQWDPPTMVPASDPGLATKTLSDDDKDAACYLYPINGSYACSTHSDCPNVVDRNPNNGQEYYVEYGQCQGGMCSGGTTQAPSCGDGQLGEICFKNDDCDCDFYCQDTGLGQICSQLCTTTNDTCPTDYECVAFNPAASADGACLPDQCNEVNEGCDSMADCCSQVCVSLGGPDPFVCRQGCDTEAQDCPSGYDCMSLGPGTSGACIPGEGVEVSLAQIGESCEENSDCASGICRSLTGLPGSFFCTEDCSSPSDCPCDMTCAETGGGGLCIPGVNASCAPEVDGGPHSGPDVIGGPGPGSPTSGSSGCTVTRQRHGLPGLLFAMMIGLCMIFFGKRREDSDGP